MRIARAELAEAIGGWVNAALSFFYPEICQICGEHRAIPAEGYVCGACHSGVRAIQAPMCDCCGRPVEGALTHAFVCENCREAPPNFSFARAAVHSRDPVLEVIHRYKYQRALWFEPFLAGLLLRAAAPQLRREEWDIIVPVPLHPTKQRQREFNQAHRLARHLSRATGIPLNHRVVRRVEPTRSQTQLTRAERLTNVQRAFAMRRGKKLDGERVVLVDDVLTTGATTSACAGALRVGGAGQVCVWTVARGI